MFATEVLDKPETRERRYRTNIHKVFINALLNTYMREERMTVE